ncbi:hypothetical protein [uncultured Gemmiger sp.]|uniref:hypothetical protein n=1 Tax=uncultured Gemmiger sp. TaxID=1623490 RepID=UPI0025D12A03|nr:hypothetical protein [uncultured Gemmiger sp.]
MWGIPQELLLFARSARNGVQLGNDIRKKGNVLGNVKFQDCPFQSDNIAADVGRYVSANQAGMQAEILKGFLRRGQDASSCRLDVFIKYRPTVQGFFLRVLVRVLHPAHYAAENTIYNCSENWRQNGTNRNYGGCVGKGQKVLHRVHKITPFPA